MFDRMHDNLSRTVRRITNHDATRRPRSGGAALLWAALALAALLAAGPASAAGDSCPGTTGAGARLDATQSFSLAFPADFTVSTDPKSLNGMRYFPLADGEMQLGGCYSGREFEGTNFGSACIVAGSRPAEAREADCARFDGDLLCGPDQGIDDVTVNGMPFKRATLSDAAMGHRLETREYWTVRHGRRYEIRLSVSYTDIGMYSPGEKREFSQEACWARLTGILNTFSFR